jgi:protein disulfide-isomerase A1
VQRPAIFTADVESLKSFMAIDETVFIAYLAADDEQSRATLEEVALRYEGEFTFGISTDVAALASEELEAPAVKCYKPLDGDTQVLRGAFSVTSLDSFIREASVRISSSTWSLPRYSQWNIVLHSLIQRRDL